MQAGSASTAKKFFTGLFQNFFPEFFPHQKFFAKKYPGPATTKPGTGIFGTHAVNPL